MFNIQFINNQIIQVGSQEDAVEVMERPGGVGFFVGADEESIDEEGRRRRVRRAK